MRMRSQYLIRHPEPLRHRRHRRGRIRANRNKVRRQLKLDLVEPVARALPDPADLLLGRLPGRTRHAPRPQPTRRVVEVDAHDVGQPPGQPEHPRRAPADEHRRMRLLHRQRPSGEARRPRQRKRRAGPVRLQNFHRLGQPLDPHSRPVHRDPEPLVLGGHPPGAQPNLDPPTRQHVQRREFLGQHHRMVVVNAEHPAPHPQLRRGQSGRRHRGQRRDVDRAMPGGVGDLSGPEVVVGRKQGRVTQILGPPGQVRPRRPRLSLERLHREPERPVIAVAHPSLPPPGTRSMVIVVRDKILNRREEP
jgi:hypothetical protein